MNEKSSLPMRATSLIMLLFLTQSPAVATQAGSVQTGDANKTMGDRDIHRLEPGKPVERKFAGGVSHSYQISLVLGQYLKASVLQKGIDVVVAVIDPNGKPVMRIDSPNSNQGPEPIHLVAETSGSYIIKIESFESGAAFGVYELQVLELRESINDDRALEEALKLYVESVRLNGQKSYEQAAGLAERALAIRERIRPAELPSLQQHLKLVADTSSNLAALYNNKGEYAKAEPLYLRSIAIREKTLGPEHPDVANSLHGLAGLYDDKGQYAKAEPLYQRAISIFEKARGPEHPGVANFLNSLALHYKTKDEYAKAEPLFQRALAISEKVLGPSHSLVGSIVNNLGLLYDAKGEYVKAEPLYQRAISIFEKTLGPDHPDLAKSLINIGALYRRKGEYRKAVPLFERAVAIFEKAHGPRHPSLASSLHVLAMLYINTGDYAKAESHLQRLIAIQVKALGPEHPDVANSLNSLASLYKTKREYEKAELLFLRSLAIKEKAFGPEHPSMATPLSNLAALYDSKGEYTKSEPLYLRSLAIEMKALGPEHPSVATSLHNLAMLYDSMGEYAKAEPLFERALSLYEKTFGPEHPSVATSLDHLASLHEAKEDLARAVAFRLRAAEISERNITLNLATGSERQKLLYLATFLGETYRTVSLHVQSAPNDPAARRLSITTILRRKGRALDAMSDSVGALRQRLDPLDRTLLDQLTETRSRLATHVLGGPGKTSPAQHLAEIKRLEEQAERLEAQVSARSAEFRAQSGPVTLESVQAAIPPGSALLEFISYYPSDAKKRGRMSRRYVAYVLKTQGGVAWVDLGDSEKIDASIRALRDALRDPDRADVKRLARAVDEKVMQPVRALLGGARTLLISPDGVLNLLPFGALVDEQDRYLVEQYSLTYLTTGRDLLRMQSRSQSAKGAMVVANPDFGEPAGAESERGLKIKKGEVILAQQPGKEAVDFSQVYFGQLPGTADEAKALKAMLPGASVVTESRATESALKEITPPAILHIATHGFFLEDVFISSSQTSSRGLIIRGDQPNEPFAPEMVIGNPLLRSGLAMAGANLHRSDGDDGILTALEVAGLNLWGTKLVVLSACDTGVGSVRNGEGIYGLRRALVLAGSETQVMSLWPVNDEGTRDLMIGYYKGLQAGQGRGEALRQIQLSMLKSNDRKHPYYWASFIQSGEWANLEGKR